MQKRAENGYAVRGPLLIIPFALAVFLKLLDFLLHGFRFRRRLLGATGCQQRNKKESHLACVRKHSG